MKGGLSLKTYDDLMKGGKDGQVIAPGDAANSMLVQSIAEGKMPKRGTKLPQATIDTIAAWVAAGRAEQLTKIRHGHCKGVGRGGHACPTPSSTPAWARVRTARREIVGLPGWGVQIRIHRERISCVTNYWVGAACGFPS